MSREQIGKALETLLAAPGPADALKVFTRHGDVLADPEALAIIEKNIALAGDDKSLAQLLRNRGHMVSEYQRAGLDAVRAAMVEPDVVLTAVNGWLACNTIADIWVYLNQHQAQLVNELAGQALHHALTQFADQPDALAKINNCLALHKVAMREGLVGARRYLGQQFIDTLNRPDPGRPPEATESLHNALLQLIDRHEERDAWISAQMNFGLFLRSQKRDQEAIAPFEASLAALREGIRPGEHFRCHYELGSIATRGETWDTKRATKHLRAALAVGLCEGQEPEYLQARILLAIACLEDGDHYSAAEQLNAALAAPRAHRSNVWAVALADIAHQLKRDRSARRQISITLAIRVLHAALEETSREDDAEQWADRQQTLAMMYRDVQSSNRAAALDKALHHTSEALAVWTQERDAYQWAKLQHNLGTIYYLKTHDDAYDSLLNARRYYDAALSVHTRQRHPDDWAMTKSALGACALRLYDVCSDPAYLDLAVAEARDSYAWWSGDGNATQRHTQHLLAEANNTLGGALVERGTSRDTDDLRAGITHLIQAEGAYAKLGSVERRREVLMNLSRSFSALSATDADAFDQAVDYAQRALSVTSRETDAYLWAIFQRNYAALLANTNDGLHRETALAALDEALNVFRPDRFRADYVKTQGFAGQIHFNAKHWLEALTAFNEAIEKTDVLLQDHHTEVGRRHQIAETSTYFINAAYCLAKLKRYDESLVMLERGKARALARQLATGAVVSESDSALACEWREVADVEQAMRRLSDDRTSDHEAALAASLKSARERLAELLSADDQHVDAALPLDGILATAPDGGALIAVLVTLHGALAFVVPHGLTSLSEQNVVHGRLKTDELQAVLVGTEKRAGLVRLSLRAKYAKDKRDGHKWRQRYARRLGDCCDGLWDAFLKPVVQRLEEIGVADQAPLIFLPQGGLGMLPLHAARDASVARGAAGHWPILERFNVSYAPNAYALRAARREYENNRDDQATALALLAVLNPTDDLAFAELEGALALTAIDAHESSRRVLRGADATAGNVTQHLSEFDYLHFACHGSFNLRHPDRSALRLAGGTVLELGELIGPGIDLSRCRLVALSACETGMIEIQQSPDEYIGLPAALLKAGAPAVLGTLWEVDDLASAVMVGEFYRQHLVYKHSPARALGLAQRWLGAARYDEIARWLDQRLEEILAANPQLDAAEIQSSIKGIKHSLARGKLGQVPFSNPWYWAAFTITGV